MSDQTTHSSGGTDQYATEEEMAEFAASISGKLGLDAVADGSRCVVINATPACLQDNKRRLEDEGYNTELYIDGELYVQPTLIIHPRPGDLQAEGVAGPA